MKGGTAPPIAVLGGRFFQLHRYTHETSIQTNELTAVGQPTNKTVYLSLETPRSPDGVTVDSLDKVTVFSLTYKHTLKNPVLQSFSFDYDGQWGNDSAVYCLEIAGTELHESPGVSELPRVPKHLLSSGH